MKDELPSVEMVQRAYERSKREATRAAVLCTVPVAMVGALAYAVGAHGLVIVAVEYLTGFLSFRIWRRRYEVRTAERQERP